MEFAYFCEGDIGISGNLTEKRFELAGSFLVFWRLFSSKGDVMILRAFKHSLGLIFYSKGLDRILRALRGSLLGLSMSMNILLFILSFNYIILSVIGLFI